MNIPANSNIYAILAEKISESNYLSPTQSLEEANFGYRHISAYVNDLKDGNTVLEVGSGTGILISILAKQMPNLKFTGIEPGQAGFGQYLVDGKVLINHNINNLNIFTGNYEDFEINSKEIKYNIIYTINVLEHLLDWKDFIRFIKNKLKPNGKAIILCPNYSFPYEPHFRIPLIINSKITYSIFKKRILNFEKSNNCNGLWMGLNFVTWTQLNGECKKQNLKSFNNSKIIEDLFERLNIDEKFSSRHKLLKIPVKILIFFKIKKILKFNIIKKFLPYMLVEIKL